MVAENQEQLMCNICGVKITTADITQHIVTTSHALKKSTLEQEYNDVAKKYCQDDVSVIASWERGIDRHTISRS
ncbi:MAG TPA: hypothetical protein VGE82_01365 [Nitrososphaera sp.]|jgi:hypothetical protein